MADDWFGKFYVNKDFMNKVRMAAEWKISAVAVYSLTIMSLGCQVM